MVSLGIRNEQMEHLASVKIVFIYVSVRRYEKLLWQSLYQSF